MYEPEEPWNDSNKRPSNYLPPPPQLPDMRTHSEISVSDLVNSSNIQLDKPRDGHQGFQSNHPSNSHGNDRDYPSFDRDYGFIENRFPMNNYGDNYSDKPYFDDHAPKTFDYQHQSYRSQESFAPPTDVYSSPLKSLEATHKVSPPSYFPPPSLDSRNYSNSDPNAWDNTFSYFSQHHRTGSSIPYNERTSYDDRGRRWNNTSSFGFEDNRRPPPVQEDPNLPQEIASLFQTNHCILCGVRLNSRIQSKTHYDGKPHKKALKSRLEEYHKQRSNATPSQNSDANNSDSTISKKAKGNDYIEASNLYCKCCNISFTSTVHATTHYMGRNHQRVMHGLQPYQVGYFNEDSKKWQRNPTDPITPTLQLAKDGSKDSNNKRFYCSLCDVATTCQSQLDEHLVGSRHRNASAKKLKTEEHTDNKTGAGKTNKKGGLNRPPKPTESILASVMKEAQQNPSNKKKKTDISAFRTPSGQYYCSKCDVTSNSADLLYEHLNSRKHRIFPRKKKNF